MGIEILGSAFTVPQRCVTNQVMMKIVDTDDEWIRTRTGIETRYHADDETVTTLGTEAGRKAIERAGLQPEDIDCIIAATFTGETMTPSAACLIQESLGIADKPVFAFDINGACTGFIYALNVASSLLATGQVKCALVMGVEILTNVTNFADRSTCVLFGDGCGAVVVKNNPEKQSVFFTAAHGDSSGDLEARAWPERTPLHMEGNKVFRFATAAMAEALDEVLDRAGLTIDAIDYIIPHQANIRIIDYVTKKSGIAPEKVYININKYGNTSSAGMAIAFAEMAEKDLLMPGMKIVLVGFGGGYTFGAAVVEI